MFNIWEGDNLKSWINFRIVPDKFIDNRFKGGNYVRSRRAKSGIIPNFL